MQTNDYHQLPASEKQIRFARSLAAKAGTTLPDEVQLDRRQISAWIDAQQAKSAKANPFDSNTGTICRAHCPLQAQSGAR